MTAYYNEFDPYAAEWLRGLIVEGLIAPGDVDDRPIQEVQPNDITGYTQHHFFAGIGGWSAALRLAGWPDDTPVWTGSCPCQPFSIAGKRKGTADERHLWPEFFRLILERQPATVFGEQVASKAGREWLAGVFDDLEGVGYAVAGADLCAAGVGAPHIRQRLFWVADAERRASERRGHDMGGAPPSAKSETRKREWVRSDTGSGGDISGVEHAPRDGRKPWRAEPDGGRSAGGCSDMRLGDTGIEGPQERAGDQGVRREETRSDPWKASVLAGCRDGRARRIPLESGLFPLAHGVSGRMAVRRTDEQAAASHTKELEHWYSRVGALRGIGNAIVPQVAAEFIRAWMELDTP